MQGILSQIENMTMPQLQKVMEAVEQRLIVTCPERDFVYLAIPKEPKLRQQALLNIWNYLQKNEPAEQ